MQGKKEETMHFRPDKEVKERIHKIAHEKKWTISFVINEELKEKFNAKN